MTAAILDFNTARLSRLMDDVERARTLAAIHLAQDADFYGPEIEARRSVVGGVARSGTRGGRE